jgi:hypothetical protein
MLADQSKVTTRFESRKGCTASNGLKYNVSCPRFAFKCRFDKRSL